jgi:hypothetical protein
MEFEDLVKYINDSVVETKNPSGHVIQWDEIISSGYNRAIITYINKNNSWIAISLKPDFFGEQLMITLSEQRNWKRTGRNFKILESILRSI